MFTSLIIIAVGVAGGAIIGYASYLAATPVKPDPKDYDLYTWRH